MPGNLHGSAARGSTFWPNLCECPSIASATRFVVQFAQDSLSLLYATGLYASLWVNRAPRINQGLQLRSDPGRWDVTELRAMYRIKNLMSLRIGQRIQVNGLGSNRGTRSQGNQHCRGIITAAVATVCELRTCTWWPPLKP